MHLLPFFDLILDFAHSALHLHLTEWGANLSLLTLFGLLVFDFLALDFFKIIGKFKIFLLQIAILSLEWIFSAFSGEDVQSQSLHLFNCLLVRLFIQRLLQTIDRLRFEIWFHERVYSLLGVGPSWLCRILLGEWRQSIAIRRSNRLWWLFRTILTCGSHFNKILFI